MKILVDEMPKTQEECPFAKEDLSVRHKVCSLEPKRPCENVEMCDRLQSIMDNSRIKQIIRAI